MKKNILVVFFVFLLTIKPQHVYAHILKTDGSIGAVMHITPDDDPIAGEISNFYFEFKDKEEKFKSENCECKITVVQNGNDVFTQDLFAKSISNHQPHSTFAFTFPQKDIYKIKIAGKPIVKNSFKEFTLIYDVRVERISENINEQDNNSNTKKLERKNPLLTSIPTFIFTFFGIVIILHLIIARFAKK